MPGASPVKSDAGSPFSVAPACTSAARTAVVTTRFCVTSVVVVAAGTVVVDPDVALVEPATGGVDCAAFGLDEHPARTTDRQAANATARSFFRAIGAPDLDWRHHRQGVHPHGWDRSARGFARTEDLVEIQPGPERRLEGRVQTLEPLR
jgi:hypothetical protein